MYFEDQNLDLRQHSYIFAEKGYTPQPQRKVFGSLHKCEYPILAEYVMNLHEGVPVHRHALFGYIMAKFPGLSVEAMQAAIQNRLHWNRCGNGYYSLTEYGEQLAWDSFVTFVGEPGDAGPMDSFRFVRYIGSLEVAIRIFPRIRRTRVTVRGSDISGTEACELLIEHGARFRTQSSRSTTQVWNWIIQDDDYYWERYSWR